jgi:hypothetical protein
MHGMPPVVMQALIARTVPTRKLLIHKQSLCRQNANVYFSDNQLSEK